jgi:hypothetical protein
MDMHYSILRRIRHEAVRGCKEAMMRATTVSKFSHTVIGMRTVGPVSINQAGRLIRTLISTDIITKERIKKETRKAFKNIDNYRPTALTVLSAHGRLSIYRYHRLTPSDLQTQIRVSRPIPGPPGCLSRTLD